ncbi:hypothetical protein DNTS_012064 [Danionella cerebrum]|uniref:EGF-like domain-containing protein n=1 Tax=Danionella cerebrum TaxID=2873325 RepID=A0A553QPF5_9TELE|nr:hypothetical protein DNTS_012064 [Danionella translucida]
MQNSQKHLTHYNTPPSPSFSAWKAIPRTFRLSPEGTVACVDISFFQAFSGVFQEQYSFSTGEQEVKLVAQMQPCVQGFTRMVKAWKQGCEGQAWCMGYERRTAYYTAYRQVYRQEHHTVYKCCRGWSQLNGEAGCLYPVCSYGVCFNGGQCREGSAQLCVCPGGFSGPSCQYGKSLCFLFLLL